MPDKDYRLVVIGASAGGHSAVIELLNQMPADINAAFVIVQHTSADASLYFGQILQKRTKLHVEYATHGKKIERGGVYLSIPDHHLLVDDEGTLILSKGPTENRTRPAIDPLFRNAAASFSNRVIGIVLTGMLNDGTSGLIAIKKCHGYTMVQSPKTAEYPEMPNHALQAVKPDICCSIEEMGGKIQKLVKGPLKDRVDVPTYIRQEAAISRMIDSRIDLENELGEKVPYGCPECGGPLWQMKNEDTVRFRCHTGHGYTAEALINGQNAQIEESLWIALRTLEERINILRKTLLNHEKHNHEPLIVNTRKKIEETEKSITILREAMQIRPPVQEGLGTSIEIADC